ncbi:MAG: protein kinase [Anaerolineales bacterium]
MPLAPGSILRDRYRIEDQLGKGGMGAVYLAHDLTLDLRVAVKENLSINPDSEEQFLREARLLAELRHPNLPRVTDYFVLETRQYLVMDFIAGEDLHTHTQKHPPTVEEVLNWADQVCSALAYLHAQSPPVIHRDVKPANLKLQPDGSVVLVDFGLAKTSDQAITATGARGLTPGYSPPEQYGAQRTDARSDQYALAATLYNLFSQQKPADSIQRMMKKAFLKPVLEVNPAVPDYVNAALQRALSLDPDERFPSIREFQAALRGALQAETVRAPTEPVEIKLEKSKRRNVFIFGGVIAVALIGAGLVYIFGSQLGLIPRSNTPTATNSIVSAAMTSSPTEEIAATVDETQLAPSVPDNTPTEEVTPSETPVMVGGGGRIAFVSDRGGDILQIWTMNPDGSNPRQLTFGPGDKTQPKWSPDGTRLLYVTGGGQDQYGNDLGTDIRIINVDGTGIEWVVHSAGDDSDPAWSPDGRFIAFTSTRAADSRQVYVFDASCLEEAEGCVDVTPTPVSCHPDFCAVEYSPAWAPLDFSPPSWLPASYTLAVVVSINTAPGKIFFRPPADVMPIDFDRSDKIVGVDHVAWSPDGTLLAYTWYLNRGVNEIFISPLEDRGATWTRLTESNGNKEPCFSPDGRWIVFTSTRDQNPEIYIMITNGTGEENLTNNPARDMQPDWQPPGK